jgi:hypothetical protein
MVRCYNDMRERIDALAVWRESGRPLPDVRDDEAKAAIIQEVFKEKKQGGWPGGGRPLGEAGGGGAGAGLLAGLPPAGRRRGWRAASSQLQVRARARGGRCCGA